MEVKHNVDQMKFWTEVDGYEAHVAYQLMIKDWIFVIQSFLQRLGEEVLLRRW